MQEEVKKLLDHCVEYATDLLINTGEAYPFGGFLDTLGQVHPMEMEVDKKNVPTIEKVVNTLSKFGDAEMDASKMRGYAVTYEAEVALSEVEVQNCIAIDIRYIDEDFPVFYLPFTWRGEEMKVGDLFAVRR